ncbi:MAG: penicillin acylase family protein [Flavobacteriia bacterium]|nr:MAG: penicillin acylase family protein [Flavobacteriia bacterium]
MLKKILKILLVLVLLLAIGFWFFVRNNKPVYKGDLQLTGLQNKVNVYFDEIGVPHIYAENQQDAYTAFGYLHAQDRLWQMELMRRIAAGRLSEIFGEKMIKIDKFFLGLGIKEAALKDIKRIDTTSISYKMTKAYLNGINQFIEKGPTPVEFHLLGLEKEKYTIQDIYNVLGYMSFSFAMAYKTDPMLTSLREKLGDRYVKELDINFNPKSTLIYSYNRNSKKLAENISSSVNSLLKSAPVPQFIGSNSWVVGAKKTKNKKVIFANDPHIAFSQPAVWYQSHIVTPEYEIYGFNLALTPFPLLGHNRKYAYGITMFENDDIDFFEEPEGQNYKIRTETIKVKDGDDVTFQFKTGKNGPIVNDFVEVFDVDKDISMDWIYTKQPNEMLEVSYEISHARSLADFKKGVSKINAPGLNMMYGDAKNNIAWFASAKLYERENVENTKFILNAKNNKLKYLGFNKNPQAVNPRWNYVYSANNQPDAIDGRFYPGYYVPQDRAKRIVDLLKENNDIDLDFMKRMITDDTSSMIVSQLKVITKEISDVNLSKTEKQAMEVLKNWKGDYKKELTGPTIFNRFLYRFLYNTFADEMGEKTFKLYLGTYLAHRQIDKQIKRYKSVWWDDKATKDILENREEIFTRSFHEAITALEEQFGDDVSEWTWDKALSITHKHAFNEVESLKGFFNVGPFKTDGGNEVINNQIFTFTDTGEYEVIAGPSTRRLIDFSDVENCLAILPTGQSGNVFSKHYSDQAEKYLKGEFFKMKLNQEEIQSSKDLLVLSPKDSVK